MSTTENAAARDVRRGRLPKVSPRYLAGPGQDNPSMVLDGLEAAGWYRLGDEVCTVRAFTADQRRCVTFHPERQKRIGPGLYTLWQAGARADAFSPVAWEARFTAETPVEFISAFARALAEPEGGEGGVPHFLRAPEDPDQVMCPLAEAGWAEQSGQYTKGYRSPDGLAGMYHLPVDPAAEEGPVADHQVWKAYAVASRTRFAWTAKFTVGTPAHLTGAFLSALADPAGVPRDPGTLPPAHLDRLTLV